MNSDFCNFNDRIDNNQGGEKTNQLIKCANCHWAFFILDGASITDKDDLLGEIQMLKQAGRHPNIVALIGACTQKGMLYPSQYILPHFLLTLILQGSKFIISLEEILVVTELIPNGSLDKFLKSKRMVRVPGEASVYENVHFGLNDRELLVIAHQIALGMKHLEEKKV